MIKGYTVVDLFNGGRAFWSECRAEAERHCRQLNSWRSGYDKPRYRVRTEV